MALNKAVLAAVRAITKLRPGSIQDSYMRQRIAEDASSKLVVASPLCRIDEMTALASDGYEIPLKVFTPLNIYFSFRRGTHVEEENKGTILYLHGGGWANGDVDFYTASCMRTALKLERRVISVDYRRSPENKFPQAPEDCYEVARQLFAGTLIPKAEPDNIVLMGDSAGGNLAAVVSLMARDRKEFTPRTQILLYPLTYNDHSASSIFPSVMENGEGFLLTRKDIEGYIGMYLNGPDDYANPYFAPLLSPSLADQPRTLVISAEYCPLRDEDETYAARIEADGGQASCYRMLNGVHGYFLYPSVLNLVRDTYRIIQHFLDGKALPAERQPRWLELLGTD